MYVARSYITFAICKEGQLNTANSYFRYKDAFENLKEGEKIYMYRVGTEVRTGNLYIEWLGEATGEEPASRYAGPAKEIPDYYKRF